jgi:subtilisin family serine protease
MREMLTKIIAAIAVMAMATPPVTQQDVVFSEEDNWGLDRIYQPQGDAWIGGRLFRSDGFDWAGEGYGGGIVVYVVDSGINNDQLFNDVGAGFAAVGKSTADCGNLHGTKVASLIAGIGYGIAEQATIIPVRVLKCNGAGTQSAIVAGLKWILANADPTVSVVNISVGGSKNNAIDAAVKKLTNAGIPVVIAAGNNGSNVNRYSPARVSCTEDLAISVGASTLFDLPWTGSNYGDCLTLYAPGVSLVASYGAGDTNVSGTSFSAPYVSGAIAAYASFYGISTEDAFYEMASYFDPSITIAARRGTTSSVLQMFPIEDDWSGDYCWEYYGCWP